MNTHQRSTIGSREEDTIPGIAIGGSIDAGTRLVTVSEAFTNSEAVSRVNAGNIVEVEVVEVLELNFPGKNEQKKKKTAMRSSQTGNERQEAREQRKGRKRETK
jgi:hypothetical protein